MGSTINPASSEQPKKTDFVEKSQFLTSFFSKRSVSTKMAFLLLLAALISGIATYAALTETPPLGNDPKTVIWLLNLDLIILLLLMSLIARRIVGLWSGRRQKLAGAQLHVRLVLIFSILATTPAIIMTVFSAFFFHYGVQSWFSDRVRTAVYESQAVAEAYVEEHQQVIRADLLAMAQDIDRQASLFLSKPETLQNAVQTQSLLRNLSEAMIFDGSGRILAKSALTFTLAFETLPDYHLQRAYGGDVVITTAPGEDRVRALVKLNNMVDTFLYVGRMVDPSVLSHLAATSGAVEEYTQLQAGYAGLHITVTMIFVVVAALLLFTAIWLGIVLARQLITPISALISASDRVRAGDLSARVPEKDKIEEFDYLARSFNRMTRQIQQQRDDLITANRQLDERRRFTETVLTNVSAGIIGVDEQGRVTIANMSAAKLLSKPQEELHTARLVDIIPELQVLLEQAFDKPDRITQEDIPYVSEDEEGRRIFHVRIAVDHDQTDKSSGGSNTKDKSYRGAVITFDDITELQSAQRKAAWADVARRIAHEIKNPLTPIQLSAERLKRKYLKDITEDPEIFSQCTDTIVRHVGDIGRMVDEFSAFARMPQPVIEKTHIENRIRETVALQKHAYPDIEFALMGFGQDYGLVLCDTQQLRQALTNLLQNSVDSIAERENESSAPEVGQIHILLTVSEEEQMLRLTVSDNGLGLPEKDQRDRLTEPYVTHKQKGTGLGLAIVKKIMEDHKGKLILGKPSWLQENPEWIDLGGASVSLVFPLENRDHGDASNSKTSQTSKAA